MSTDDGGALWEERSKAKVVRQCLACAPRARAAFCSRKVAKRFSVKEKERAEKEEALAELEQLRARVAEGVPPAKQ